MVWSLGFALKKQKNREISRYQGRKDLGRWNQKGITLVTMQLGDGFMEVQNLIVFTYFCI